jgi:hypothetical protein
VSPVKYEVEFDIPDVNILHSHRRGNKNRVIVQRLSLLFTLVIHGCGGEAGGGLLCRLICPRGAARCSQVPRASRASGLCACCHCGFPASPCVSGSLTVGGRWGGKNVDMSPGFR